MTQVCENNPCQGYLFGKFQYSYQLVKLYSLKLLDYLKHIRDGQVN